MPIEYIENVTGLNRDQRENLIAYLKNLPEVMIIEIHRNHHVVMKQLGHHFLKERSSEFHYSTFLTTLEKMKKLESSPSMKAKLTDSEKRLIDQYRVARINADPPKKKSVKRDKIFIQYRPLIKNLREQGLSWANISVYMKKHHKLKISPAYIQRLFTPPLNGHKNNDDGDYIKTLTKMAHAQRIHLVSEYCKFSESDRIRIHAQKIKISDMHKQYCDDEKKSEFHYSCLLISINDFFFEKLKEKNEYGIEAIRVDKVKKINKRLIKNKIDTNHLEDLLRMRLKGVSWRNISVHFLNQHAISISHTSLKKIYDDIILNK